MKKKKIIHVLLLSTMLLSSVTIPMLALAENTKNEIYMEEATVGSKQTNKKILADGSGSDESSEKDKALKETMRTDGAINVLKNSAINRTVGKAIDNWTVYTGLHPIGQTTVKSVGGLTTKRSPAWATYYVAQSDSEVYLQGPAAGFGIITEGGSKGKTLILGQQIGTIAGRRYNLQMGVSGIKSGYDFSNGSSNILYFNGSSVAGSGGIASDTVSISNGSNASGLQTVTKDITATGSTGTYTIRTVYEAGGTSYNGINIEHVAVYEYANDVTVNYVDKTGTALANKTVLTGFVGETYATFAKPVPGYNLKSTSGDAEGVFNRVNQTVTYTYERRAGAPITVNYKDNEGNLLGSDTLNGSWGDAWTADSKVIDGYEVVNIPDKENGIFGDTPQTIEYIYKKLLPGEVLVEYVDEEGQDILDANVLTGIHGTTYETTAPVVEGFELKTTPGNATGTYDQDNSQKVTYVYARLQGAPVTVKYVDEAGKEIATSDSLTGKFGTIYDTNPKAIAGYHLTQAPTNESGEFTMNPQTVTYVYAAQTAGTITVNYVDQDGGLLDSETLNGKFDEAYTTEQKSITGYEFTGLGQGSAPTNGTFTLDTQTVTYQYQAKEAAPVTVKYVDTVGNVLEEETLTGLFGTGYTTEAKEFAGYALKTTPNNADGTFSMDPQTVTYVYEAGRGGTITVKYINQEGNEIAAAKALNGKVGQSFTETAKMPSGYDLIGDSQRTFTVTAEPQTVVFEYVGKNASKLTIQYVDEATGDQIAPATGFTGGKTGDAYTAEVKTIPGYTVVDDSKAIGFRPMSATTYQITYKKNDAIPFDLNYVGANQQKVIGFLPTGVTTSQLSLYVKKAGDDEWRDSGYTGTADATTGYFAIESRLVKGGKGFLLENQDQVKVVFTGNDGNSYEGVKVVQPYTAPAVDVYTAGEDNATGTVPNGANYVRLAINNIPTRTVATTPTPGSSLPGNIDAKTGNFTVYAKNYSDGGKLADTKVGDTLTFDYGLQIYGAQNNPSTTIIVK